MSTECRLHIGAIALLSAVLFAARSSAAENPKQQQSTDPRPARVRVAQFRPTPDTEMTLNEMFVATDGNGHRRVVMSGPLTKGKADQFFWFVDSATRQYHVLRLTSSVQADAKRLQKAYQRFGVELSEEYLAVKLRQDQGAENRMREFENRAGWERASAWVEDDCAERSGGPSLAGVGQWVQYCQGHGAVTVQTWEPARYVFPVDHLAETYREAWWGHDTSRGTITSLSTTGRCWANPATFYNTHWEQTFCDGRVTNSFNGFDTAQTGQYLNRDFVFWFVLNNFHIPLPYFTPIYISSTAAVQVVNGWPNWGYDHYEDYSGLVGWAEGFLLTAKVWGFSQESGCNWSCEPSDADLAYCEWRDQTDESSGWYWDWTWCECRGSASPIIIDLNGDGIALTNTANGVNFDVLASGGPVHVSWTAAASDDAFLVLDRNGNGTIDNGSELFGNFTPQPVPGKRETKNGFRALAVYDDAANGGNGDRQITEEDTVYQNLRLWIDANHDGVSQADELKPLDASGVRAIMLHYVDSRRTDEFGNAFRFASHVLMDRDLLDRGPMARRAADVFLVIGVQ